MSAFQRIAAFQKIGNAKIGGNVASYFCTADGDVLHIIAGPVSPHVFLREASWANETFQMAQLENQTTPVQLREFFRKAHLARLQHDHRVNVPEHQLPKDAVVTARTIGELFDQNWQLDNAGKLHLLLAVAPLPRIEQVYQGVFERILNQKVSTNPVAAQ